MQSFFTPALVLMNRLRYPQKFALLGLMSLIAIAVVMSALYLSLTTVIRASEQELAGVSLIQPASQAIQLLQQHRGLSVGAIGGVESMTTMRAAKEKETAAAIQKLAERLPPAIRAGNDWKSIEENWKRLQKSGITWTATKNLAAHTELIGQLLNLQVIIADDYMLTLDPEIGTYYLMDAAINNLPTTQEMIGRIRAYGISILANKRMTQEQWITLNAMVAELDSGIKSLRIGLDKTGRYNPQIQATLFATSNELIDAANNIANLTISDFLTGHVTRPNDFYIMTTAALDRSYVQLHGTILPTLEALLKARITHKQRVLYASIVAALLLFLVVTYFSIGMYYATIGSIRSLAHSANKFASGDTWERVDLHTRDELQQVSDSFNKMAEASNRMTAKLLETHTALEQDITERKLTEKKLSIAYDQLELMARSLETVREEEQKRIARELHDEMGGVLAALNMKLARLGAKLPAELTQLSAEVSSMTKLLAAAIQAMRHTVAKLRPSILDDAGLAAAIECYAMEFQENTGIECRTINRLPEEEPTLNSDCSATVFRVLQESLTNVAKHAQADMVTILLKERGKSLVLIIHDSGNGFATTTAKERSFGLRGIKERIFMVGGRFRIRSVPGKGTAVWVSVPMYPPTFGSDGAEKR